MSKLQGKFYKLKQSGIVVFWLYEELQILFADSQEEFDTILNKKYN
jgi:hypothetical protein